MRQDGNGHQSQTSTSTEQDEAATDNTNVIREDIYRRALKEAARLRRKQTDVSQQHSRVPETA